MYAKLLNLITPEKANALNVPAEVPVFVSPFVTGKEPPCRECGTAFKPLVYQVGYTVYSHHFCVSGGGIYCFANARQPHLYQSGYWTALVEPLGRRQREGNRIYGRTERVEHVVVHRIAARCRCCARSLDAGTLVYDRWKDALLPLCADCRELGTVRLEPTDLGFQITERGSVLFRKEGPPG